ncbi:hypothetical protein EXU30_10775 [Shewanella maritima]|uniref:Uncharacterized protein n=1 Tax=Shewanella maritima TaxID=2520507 RepID=A0A411PI40_9GAMM|nr:hypothetical protein [Shewanella maritima]QBF83124.1 hypothetical protein EXU30_10775 [Shewanella maritima]
MLKSLPNFKIVAGRALVASFFETLLQPLKVLRDKLSMSQKLYLVALIILITTQSLAWVGIFSVIGMAIEFWPIFERMWHSLAGKAFFLLFYAIVANFALATAGSVVNEVVGVSASHFNYTHNFAILLYIPKWIIITSCFALILMQMLLPVYAFCVWLLQMMGVKFKRLTDHQDYHRITYWVRLVLAWVIMYHLLMFIGVNDLDDDGHEEAKQVQSELVQPSEDHEQTKVAVNTGESKDELAQDNQLGEVQVLADSDEKRDDTGLVVINSDLATDEIQYQVIRDDYFNAVREAIAVFAFYLEADSFSRCSKAQNSKVMELNDYEFLEITPNNKAKYGFDFEVKKCVSPAFPAS